MSLMVERAAAGEARIVIVFENRDPIDLLDFTASLSAVAREHEARARANSPSINVDETRLLVVDVRKGSIVLELLPALAPIISSMEYTNTAIDFVKHLAGLVSPLKNVGGRLTDPATQQLKNMNDMVASVAKDSGGQLFIAAKYTNGTTLQELVIRKEDAQVISANALAQRREIENRSSSILERVLMTLHQSSVEDLKVGKKTSEKGIVERIGPIPRPLIYASDLAGQRIKEEIFRSDGNPFQKGFVIDVDVETVGGKPRAYRVLAVHEVIDLDEED